MAQQQGNGQQGDQPSPMPGGRRGRDPLGRSTRNDGGYDTRDVQVPEQGELGQARDVLEELYRRSGDRAGRPPSSTTTAACSTASERESGALTPALSHACARERGRDVFAPSPVDDGRGLG